VRSDSALNIQGPGLATPVVVPVQSNAAFAAGQLVFRDGQSLVARPFDERVLQFTGPPVTLAEGVSFNPLNGRTLFDVSEDLLAYRLEDRRKLTWRDRNGRSHGSIGEIGQDWDPAIAPDGSGRVAIDRHDPLTDGFHVWIIDDHGHLTQVSSGTRERWPTWSSDGKWIVHWAVNGDTHELRRRSSDGRGAGEVLLRQAGPLTPLDYSHDGRFLVYQTGQLRSTDARWDGSSEGDDLWMLPLVGDDRQPRRITNTPAIVETTARLSPDVRWIAYTSLEGGEDNIWAQEFPSGTAKRQISVRGGIDPNWSADGKELFYVTLDGKLMAVPVTRGEIFTFGSPVPLFKFDPGPRAPLHHYSATPDGQRFLVSEMSGAPAVITLVVHWTSLLR
jgi:hypothetical protein